MSKSKSRGSKAGSKPTGNLLTKTKDMGVTKPTQTPKSKSADLAKKVAAKHEGLEKQKKLKKPDPESSDSSDSDSDEDSVDDVSDSELNGKTVPKIMAKQSGSVKAQVAESDDTTEDSDELSNENSDESSDESSDGASNEGSDAESDLDSPSSASSDERESAKAVVSRSAVNGKMKALSDSSDESDGSEGEEANEFPKGVKVATEKESSRKDNRKAEVVKRTGVLKEPLAPAPASEDSDEGDSDSESVSDSDSDEGSSDPDSDESNAETREEEVKAKPQQKRKADQEAGPFEPKRSKTEAVGNVTTSPNLFVGQLSWNVDDEWLYREFEEFGELAGARVITDRQSGRSKGFGYVEYVNAADAAKALAAKNNAELDGRKIRLDFSEPRRPSGNFQDRAQARAKSFGDQSSPASDTLFVGNIAFDATEEAITEAFNEYGSITGVRLPTDRETGAPKGFGYVSFSNVEEATAALKGAQGLDVAGRPLRLDFSTPRTSNNDSPFRGGRGGRGGGGGRGSGRGGFGDRGGRGGRGGARGGRGGSTNRGGFGDFSGQRTTF